MPVIQDEEFGKITIRRSPQATQVRIRVAPDGSLRASIPMYAPLRLVKYLLKTSRSELREMLQKAKPTYEYENGMPVGKSHTLIIHHIHSPNLKVVRHGLQIIVDLPIGMNLSDSKVADAIREVTIKALRVEAKSYLPKRLEFLSMKYGYKYNKVRFSHAGGRWGSCSSSGTISLNIALMKLPFELIDYVIIHEISHTEQMNHSDEFWSLVEQADPNYMTHRKALRSHSPSI